MLKIQSFALPPVQTNAFLVVDTETRKALLIDAPQGVWDKVGPIVEREGLTLEACVLTHAHFDHVLGANTLNAEVIPLYLHEADREMLEKLPAQLQLFGIPTEAADITIDHWLSAPMKVTLIGREWEVRHVPGHCPGNIALYCEAEELCFVGDAIFAGSIGRTDLPGGSFEVLAKSIREQLYTMPESTTLYPGHGPTTTVAREMKGNPYVPA